MSDLEILLTRVLALYIIMSEKINNIVLLSSVCGDSYNA